MSKEIGSLSIKVGMDSNDFQVGVTGINREMKKVQSEFKLANSVLGKHGNELDKLKLKSDLFSKKVELQKRVINELEEAHKKSADLKGVDARATQNLAIKLNNARTKLNYMERDLKENNLAVSASSKGLNIMNQKLKMSDEKFRLAISGLGNYGSELDKSKLKSKYLSKQLEVQKDKVKALNELYKESADCKGADSKETQKLASEMNNAKIKVNNLSSELSEVNQDIDKQCFKWNRLDSKLSKIGDSFKKVGSKLSSVGSELNTKLTVPIAAAGVGMFKLAGDFEESVKKVSTISEAAVIPIKEMRGEILELSDDIGVAATEVSESVYQAISATEDTANAIDYVRVSAKAGIGGFADTATAIDGLTTIMNAYGLKGSKAMEAVSDQMLTAQNVGKTTFGEIANGIGDVIPLAASLDLSTKDLFASIATLTKNGIKTNKSITGLKSAYSNILKPTKDAIDISNRLGIEFNASHLRSVGWAKFIEEVGEKTNGNTESMAKLFGSVEALNSVTVLATTGSEDFAKALDSMENSAGATNKAFEIMDEGGLDTFEDTLNSTKNLGIELGTKLLPIFNKFLEKINELVSKFKNLDGATQETILKIAGLGIVIGPVLSVGGKLVSGTGTLIKLGGSLAKTIGSVSGVMAGASTATGTLGASTGVLGTAIAGVSAPLAITIAGLAGLGFVAYKLDEHLSKSAIPAVELFDDKVSEASKSIIGDFLELNEKTTMSLKEMAWSSKTITSEMTENISNDISNMTRDILEGLEKRNTEAIARTQNVINNTLSLSLEEREKILQGIKSGYEDKKKAIENGEANINKILKSASDERRALNAEEKETILKIQNDMKTIGIESLSSSETESKTILERMKANSEDLSAQQAAAIVKKSLDQRNATVSEAEKQRNEIVNEITKQRDQVGAISQEQAKKLIEEAEFQNNIVSLLAVKMHENVVDEAKKQAKEQAYQVDWLTGEIKNKAVAFWDDIWTNDNGVGTSGGMIHHQPTISNKKVLVSNDFSKKVLNTSDDSNPKANSKFTPKSNLGSKSNSDINIKIQKMEVRKESDIKKISIELDKLRRRERRALGGAY